MPKFADELRSAGQGPSPIAQEEITRIKAMLKEKASNGHRQAEIAEFYYSKDDRLGTVEADYRLGTVKLTGPIKEICESLQRSGVEISLSNDLRYINHPKGSGVVTIIKAKW